MISSKQSLKNDIQNFFLQKNQKCSHYMVSTQIFNFGPKCCSQGTCGCPRPPGSSKSGLERSILAGIGFSLFGMNFYGCDQLLDYAFLLQLKVCAFRTPLIFMVKNTKFSSVRFPSSNPLVSFTEITSAEIIREIQHN